MKFFATLFLAVCWSVFSNAQIIQVHAQFDSAAIWIGDQIKLQVNMERQIDVKVKFPFWVDAIPSGIEMIELFPVDSLQISDRVIRYTQEVLITSFDSGRHVLPPIRFPFEVDGIIDTIATRQAFLDVYLIPLEEEDGITDIKSIYDLPIGWEDILPWLWRICLLLLAIALVGFGIYAYLRRRRNMPVFGSPKPVDPPHIIALRELDRLRSEKLWQSNRTKDYHTRLSDVVRAYIEGRFGVAAMEMTSDEILCELQNTGFEDNDLVGRLRKMFSLADLVKFAKLEPLPNENETSMLDSYVFVNNTIISEPTNEEIEISEEKENEHNEENNALK